MPIYVCDYRTPQDAPPGWTGAPATLQDGHRGPVVRGGIPWAVWGESPDTLARECGWESWNAACAAGAAWVEEDE